eukprot:jgi/Galph1/240/GphlegSOOS_G4948.1
MASEDSEEQTSMNTELDTSTSTLQPMVDSVREVTNQLYVLESLVKQQDSETLLDEDIYGAITKLVHQLHKVEQKSSTALGETTVPLQVLECIDRGENPSFYTLSKIDQLRRLESEKEKKLQAIGFYREALRKELGSMIKENESMTESQVNAMQENLK